VVAWLISAVVLHWLPLPIPIEAQFSRKMATLALGNSAFFGLVVYALVRRKPAAERFPASAAIVLPVAFGDAIGMAFFGDFFPTASPAASGMFAALLLLTSAVILGTGWVAGLRSDAAPRRVCPCESMAARSWCNRLSPLQ
jgi:hypothetical protein